MLRDNNIIVISCFRFKFDAAGEITGKGRIPYGDLSKLGCVVTGLPQGLELSSPSSTPVQNYEEY